MKGSFGQSEGNSGIFNTSGKLKDHSDEKNENPKNLG